MAFLSVILWQSLRPARWSRQTYSVLIPYDKACTPAKISLPFLQTIAGQWQGKGESPPKRQAVTILKGAGFNRLTIKPLLSDVWPWKFWLAARRPLLTLFWQEHSLKCCHLKAYCAEVEQEWGKKNLWDDYQVEGIWNQAWFRARNFCKDKRIKNQKETKSGQGEAGSLSSGFLPIPGEVNLSDVILGGKVAQELLLWKPWGWELFLCIAGKATIEVHTFYKFKI